MPRFVQSLVHSTRSYRRFRESHPVTEALMREWVDNARYAASGGNLQPLRYRIVTGRNACGPVFDTLSWAAYLTDWTGPARGERPTGYIIICSNTATANAATLPIDVGIAAQTIMLAATEEGFGGCMILSFRHAQLKECLALPEGIEPELVLALGRPIEDVRIIDLPDDGSIKYWRNEAGTHFVPKRSLDDVLI